MTSYGILDIYPFKKNLFTTNLGVGASVTASNAVNFM
jgi:hypothetical protein